MIWQNDSRRLEKEKRRGEELTDGGERTGHSEGGYRHAQTMDAGCGAPYSVPWILLYITLLFGILRYTTSIRFDLFNRQLMSTLYIVYKL